MGLCWLCDACITTTMVTNVISPAHQFDETHDRQNMIICPRRCFFYLHTLTDRTSTEDVQNDISRIARYSLCPCPQTVKIVSISTTASLNPLLKKRHQRNTVQTSHRTCKQFYRIARASNYLRSQELRKNYNNRG
jgi:hypothetical protein